MREDDFSAFSEVMRDLCVAFNRPFDDGLVRVFFDALKDQPIGLLRNRALLHAKSSKKFPSPGLLRPERAEDRAPRPEAGPLIQDLLAAYAVAYYAPCTGKTSNWQYSQPWTYVYRKVRVKWVDSQKKEHDEEAPECIALVIPACPEGKHPSYRITVDDMRMGLAA